MHRRVWNLHGVALEIESDYELPVVVDYALRHHPKEGETASRIELRVIAGALPVEARLSGTPVVLERPQRVSGAFSGTRFWLAAGDGGLAGDLVERKVSLFAPSAEYLAEITTLRTLLPLGIILPLASLGFSYTHAAVVVDPKGEGWMLAGSGGAGKSTTAYALVRQGWRIVCDDGALLRQSKEGVEALGLWEELHLDRALVAAFAGLTFNPDFAAHPTKGVVTLPEQSVLLTAPISRVVWLGGSGEITRAELVRYLVSENPLLFVNAPRRQLDILTALAATSRIMRVSRQAALIDDPAGVLAAAIES